jgi:hypothetical protein
MIAALTKISIEEAFALRTLGLINYEISPICDQPCLYKTFPKKQHLVFPLAQCFMHFSLVDKSYTKMAGRALCAFNIMQHDGALWPLEMLPHGGYINSTSHAAFCAAA